MILGLMGSAGRFLLVIPHMVAARSCPQASSLECLGPGLGWLDQLGSV